MRRFTLVNPRSLESAVEQLGGGSGARGTRPRSALLAGGQDLLTQMQEHISEPERLVNLKTVPGLDGLDAAGALELGALVTLAALERDPQVNTRFRVLAEASRSVGSPQIRTLGTVGGNLCQRPRCAYYRHEQARCIKKGGSECFAATGENKYNAILGGGPSWIVHPSDLAPALVALEATAELFGPQGARRLPLEQFFTLPGEGSILRENVLAGDEILVRLTAPAPAAGTRSTYLKFKERGSFDWALVSVAAVVTLEGAQVARARLVLGGVAPIPWRCEDAERLLAGRALDRAAAREAAEAALAGAQPLSGNAYKIPLAKALVERALLALAG